MRCYCCGKQGHGSNKCDMKDKIPRDKWFANKAISNLQDREEQGSTKNEESQRTDENKKKKRK